MAQALEAGDGTKFDERAAVLAHRLFTEAPIRAEQVAREPERRRPCPDARSGGLFLGPES